MQDSATTSGTPPVTLRSFPARAEELHRIRAYIRAECETGSLPASVTGDIVLAVSEACANSALHSSSANVRVGWDATHGRVEVSVQDGGVFRSRVPLPGLDGGGGGRGIPLMIALMDEVTIQEGSDDAPGTVVRLVKYAA